MLWVPETFGSGSHVYMAVPALQWCILNHVGSPVGLGSFLACNCLHAYALIWCICVVLAVLWGWDQFCKFQWCILNHLGSPALLGSILQMAVCLCTHGVFVLCWQSCGVGINSANACMLMHFNGKILMLAVLWGWDHFLRANACMLMHSYGVFVLLAVLWGWDQFCKCLYAHAF